MLSGWGFLCPFYMCVCVFPYISMVPDKWSIQEIIFYICYTKRVVEPARVAQLAACLTGDQKVAGSEPARSGNILSWRWFIKYFLWSFSPFH